MISELAKNQNSSSTSQMIWTAIVLGILYGLEKPITNMIWIPFFYETGIATYLGLYDRLSMLEYFAFSFFLGVFILTLLKIFFTRTRNLEKVFKI